MKRAASSVPVVCLWCVETGSRGWAWPFGMIAKALMKNLEVKFSLSELEFRCKTLFLIWEKHWEARI
jgi:hypothetical protein